MTSNRTPRRLIEVDLPIARISEHARKDKFGSISTLHIWWARRPLAACRAVLCAALWPDPADEHCPAAFREAAARVMSDFAQRVFPPEPTQESRRLQSPDHSTASGLAVWKQWAQRGGNRRRKKSPRCSCTPLVLREALFNFIAEFAIRENSSVPAFLQTSRALTVAAHEALTGFVGMRPLVADPFAGGGAIPLEALRIGADSFASDLNPVPVLLNRVLLELIPKFGATLPQTIRHWGEWVGQQLQSELGEYYPTRPGGQQPLNYLWARTIRCEGPVCGSEVPLLRSLWLASKAEKQVALQLVPRRDESRVDLQIIARRDDIWRDVANPDVVIEAPSFAGTVKGGSVTCPCCGYTTPVARVRKQLATRQGGSRDARLLCVVEANRDGPGKIFRLPRDGDIKAIQRATTRLEMLAQETPFGLSAIPDEPTPQDGTGSKGGGYRTRKYGVTTYGDFFNTRQLVQHLTLSAVLRRLRAECFQSLPFDEADAVQTIIALTANRQIDRDSAFCRWNPQSQSSAYTFGRQAIPMLWDFVESPALYAPGGWMTCLNNTCKTIQDLAEVLKNTGNGQAMFASATEHPLPDEACACIVTDPPYYDSVPYAELSDFFFVWLKRSLGTTSLISQFPQLTRRDVECVVNLNEGKDKAYFQRVMTECMAEARRICMPTGIAVVVFAHKSTAGWETQLQAMIDAGWMVTASWPLDTEMAHRLRALNSAALTSSIHLVCRPRSAWSVEVVGEWRDVLSELPRRIHEWMPRLAAEGVVGADAIFACLGPALEIFSRFTRVEKANGEAATLREYLECVWAAVSNEALALIFSDVDAAAFEPDARLTAMWLWTLGGDSTSANDTTAASVDDDDHADSDEAESASSGSGAVGGFTLEFDAARKIAQGLGVQLEQCRSLVEVKGDKARLRPVSERVPLLMTTAQKFDVETHALVTLRAAVTVLDRVQCAMLLFGTNQGDELKRFLIDERVGQEARFWMLADNLSKLYPSGTDERRWVEGILARKKSLGL